MSLVSSQQTDGCSNTHLDQRLVQYLDLEELLKLSVALAFFLLFTVFYMFEKLGRGLECGDR